MQYLTQIYNASFKRLPDPDGLRDWISNFSSGKDDERAVASSLLASAEFKERYGEDVSNESYVNTLYINVLGRDYDQTGYDYWLSNLKNGVETKYELLLGFSMTNFGPAVDYGSYNTSLNRRFYLPKQIRLGIENSFPIDKQNQMIFAFDVMNTINDTVAKNIGVEYIWNQMAFLRIGKTNSGDPTIGLGIKIGGVRIDLAKMQNAALGDINYISLLLN